jgi:hypothetical protein
MLALAAFLLFFVLLISHYQSAFSDKWFSSHFTSSIFMFLFFTWILSEFINNIWSWNNSQTTNKDKGSHRIIIFATYAMLFVVFLFRSLEIGIFNGDSQYVGFILIIFGIFFREWSIWILGKYFTVRVQIRDKQSL